MNFTQNQIDVLDHIMEAELNYAFGAHTYLWRPPEPKRVWVVKALEVLMEEGVVERRTVEINGIEVVGYTFTMRGHYLYCSACPDEEDLPLD